MKQSNYIKCVCLLCIFLMSSCTLYYQPHVSSKVQDQYTTYYVGGQGTQYFIKPLILKANNVEASMFVDFTFRYKKESQLNPVNCNFTFFSTQPFNKIANVYLVLDDSTKVELTAMEPLRKVLLKNGKYECRYSSNLNMNDFIQAFENDRLEFSVIQGTENTVFYPNKETQKMIHLLEVNLFQLNSIVVFE